MGDRPGQAPAVVADAGPLIHLREIERLSFLTIFEIVHVPDAVWNEAVGTGRVLARDLPANLPVQRHSVSRQAIDALGASLTGLHVGEIEALALCRALNVGLFLTDDLAAREAAALLGIQPVGSVGVVIRAFVRGHSSLSEADEALDRLGRRSTLFVTPAVLDQAREALRRQPQH